MIKKAARDKVELAKHTTCYRKKIKFKHMKSKKFLIKSTNDVLHIGNLIAWIIQENKIKKKDVSNALQILPTTLNQYFKQPSVQTAILWRLSLATNYNFLMYLGEKLNIAYETKAEAALKQEIATKNEHIKKMEIELGLLKSICGMKK